MNKQEKINIAYWIMIAVVVLTCIIVIIYLTTNAHDCMADPLKFYGDKVGERCYCIKNFNP